MARRRKKTPEADLDRNDLIDRLAELLRPLDQPGSVTVERTIHVRRVIDDAEVEAVVAMTPEKVEIGVLSGTWDGPAEFVPHLRPWRRLAWDEIDADGGVEIVIPRLVDEALEERASEHFTCRYCGEKISPEHGSDGACHGCLSEHEGRVY